MSLKKPFNLQKWIDENRALLKPPVGNKNLYVESEDYIVMIVAGPNARKDYHYNETEELFYQIEGDIIVKTQQEGNPLPPIPDLGTIDDGTPEDTDSSDSSSEEEDTDDLPF